MASNKLSNRQKMINMMYLVLLAILALNVSSEVLTAFIQFRERMNLAATSTNQSNVDFVFQLKTAIDKEVENEGRTQNVGLKDTLDQIRGRTLRLVSMLEGHISQMEEIADFDPEKSEYRRLDEQEENYQYWMGNDEEANDRRGNGAALNLRDTIDAYYSWLNNIYNSQLADSAQVPPQKLTDPEDSDGKRWEQYNFEGPVMANMATLEALKVESLQEEKRLLDLLRGPSGNTRIHS